MRIENIKVNGIKNPIGYLLENIRISFCIKDAAGSKEEYIKVEISDSKDFSNILFVAEGEDLDPACVPVEMEPKPRSRYYIRVTVISDAKETAVSTQPAYFETSKMEEAWVGGWIMPQEEDSYHPVFAKSFTLEKKVTSARLYISGLGLYAADLNGEKIGKEVLTPYYSDYHTEIQYQTFDITSQLKENNRLEVRLGNGWYKGKFGLAGRPNNFGEHFALLAEIHILLEDGTKEVIGTDKTWSYRGSDVEESGIYDGEAINRQLWAEQENPWKSPAETSVEGKITARYSLPVVEMEELPVKEVIHTPAGETVLDFGQNFAGYVQFHYKGKAGNRIVLDFGELMQEGNFYRDNYRSAKSQFSYVSDGREEIVKPEFTYFGFRYVRVTGWDGEPDLSDFTGKVLYSAMERTGFLETGHEKVNRLFLNALWGQKSNFIDFPTDCPQRDERLGWTGDGQVFSGTASYNMDTAAFYNKFIHDLRTEQKKYDGILPGVIPVLDPNGPIFSSVWGDIATILPTVLYEHFADKKALEAYYPMMKDWVDKITREDQVRGQQYLYNFGNQLGDWLALNGRTSQSMQGGTDEYFIGSCYYADSVKKTAKAAGELGKTEDEKYYNDLYEHIRNAILKEYFSESGRLCMDTQTGYIVSLYMGIYKDKQKVIEGLKTRLFRDCHRLTGGFVGAPVMCRVLAENGLVEEAFHFLTQEDYPGWLNCINLGATTVWERWNSVLQDGSISGTQMNSLNHYAYGAIIEYLYRDVAGLQSMLPGFRRVMIAPQISQRLGYVKMRYESVYGTYRSEWEILQDGRLHLVMEIPFGCSARVLLPYHKDGEEKELSAGVYEYTYQPTIELRAKYTVKTLFKDMLQDERAMEIIQAVCPMLAFFLNKGEEEYLYENLETLMGMSFMGFREEEVERLTQQLTSLI